MGHERELLLCRILGSGAGAAYGDWRALRAGEGVATAC